MLKFSNEQRVFVAEGLRDTGNLAAGAMLFGRFIADRPFSALVAFGGFAVWLAFMVVGVVLRARKES
jgi:hypothetical protein